MKPRCTLLFTALIIVSMLLAPAAPVAAQDDVPPPAPADPTNISNWFHLPEEAFALDGDLPGVALQDGVYVMQSEIAETEAAEQEVTAAAGFSSADSFGYRYQKVVPAWVDVAGDAHSTKALAGYGWMVADLPFAFTYYGHQYDQVSILEDGLLTFSDPMAVVSQGVLGKSDSPNAVVAPYWSPLEFSAPINPYSDAGVYYLAGGEAPNRWIAIEWHNAVNEINSNTRFTFEVILYENGEILFQYHDMFYTKGYACGTAGIEDRSGLVSKVTLKFCGKQSLTYAYKFVPPAAAANFWFSPTSYGGLSEPGQVYYHHIRIENTGNMGADTFDLSISSKWPWQLLDGVTMLPLTDTDADKKIDTGPVPQGAVFDLVVAITPPLGTAIGKRSDATLRVTSSLNKRKTKTARFTTAVPANFAQIHQLESDVFPISLATYSSVNGAGQFALDEDIAWEHGGVVENTTGRQFFFGAGWDISDHGDGIQEPWLAIYEHNGAQVGARQKLQDLSSAISNSYVGTIGAAALPNGNVAFAWDMSAYPASGTLNYLYAAVVDASGSIVTAPVALISDDPNIFVDHVAVAASGSDAFVVSWYQWVEDNNSRQVMFAVVGADGSLIYAPEVLGEEEAVFPYITQFGYPGSTGLSNGNTVIAWVKMIVNAKDMSKPKYNSYVEYVVVDAAGQTLKRSSIALGTKNLPWQTLDVAQLSGGEIILAWGTVNGNLMMSGSKLTVKTSYAMLSGTSYKKIKGPVNLANGGLFISIATDNLNHAVLTSPSCRLIGNLLSYGEQMNYALVGKHGALITPPLGYRPSLLDYSSLKYMGYGNGAPGQHSTSYTEP